MPEGRFGQKLRDFFIPSISDLLLDFAFATHYACMTWEDWEWMGP